MKLYKGEESNPYDTLEDELNQRKSYIWDMERVATKDTTFIGELPYFLHIGGKVPKAIPQPLAAVIITSVGKQCGTHEGWKNKVKEVFDFYLGLNDN